MDSPRPESAELPPLLALPLEIKQNILSYLGYDDEPTLAILRRTHSIFFHAIPKAEIRARASCHGELRWQLLTTENKYPYLLEPGFFPCYTCFKVLPRGMFTDAMTGSVKGKNKRTGIGGSWARNRLCLNCGMEKNIYSQQYAMFICGKHEIPCNHCGRYFFKGDKHARALFCPVHQQRELEVNGTGHKAGETKKPSEKGRMARSELGANDAMILAWSRWKAVKTVKSKGDKTEDEDEDDIEEEEDQAWWRYCDEDDL